MLMRPTDLPFSQTNGLILKPECFMSNMQSYLIASLFLFYMNVLPARMSVHSTCAQCPRRPEENIRSPRTGVTESSSNHAYAGD